MASKNDKSTKENGHIVMKALKDIQKTPTLVNLTRFISTTYGTNLEDVKEPLKNILGSGMALGIFTRKNGKYYLYGEESEEDEKEEGELVDATRRRKSSTKSSKKSRSRSRRKSSSRNKSTGRSKSKSRSGSRRRRSRSRMTMQDDEE